MNDDYVEPRARTDDPETSHESMELLSQDQDRLTRSIEVVIELLEAHGALTDFELRDYWAGAWDGQFDYTLPCKARVWAREKGLVRWSGRTAINPISNRNVRVWELGRDAAYLDGRVKCPTCGHWSTIKVENV